MIKVILGIGLLFLSFADAHHREKLLFENPQYQLTLKKTKSCDQLALWDKNKKSFTTLSSNRIAFLEINDPLYCSKDAGISWENASEDNYNNGFLILNYDLIGDVDDGSHQPIKHIEYRCLLLDLATGEILNDANSNDPLCNQTPFAFSEKIILKQKTFLYAQPNKITRQYLISGDQIQIINTALIDNEWWLIHYEGKKPINGWIKADSVNSDKENN